MPPQRPNPRAAQWLRPRLRPALFSLLALSFAGHAQGQSDAAVRHVLGRMTHGATPVTIEEIDGSGITSWIQQQLAVTQGHPNPSLDNLVAELPNLPTLNDQRGSYDLKDVSRLHLAHALYSRDQLNEHMMDFWETHFSVSYTFTWRFWTRTFIETQAVARNIGIYFVWLENRDFRANALNKFEDLLILSANSPGMLVYLDATKSKASSPNENYSRELLELYTIGVQNVVQADVIEGAKLFTGVEVERVPPSQYGDPLADRVTLDDAFGQGDLNGDSIVDAADQAIVMANWFTSNPEGDVNKDGMVNFLDLGIVGANLGTTVWVYGPWYNENDYVTGVKEFYLGSPTTSFTITPPPSPTRAEKYGETVAYLQHLANHPLTAEYVSSKLIANFVYPVDPDSHIVQWPMDLALLRGQCKTTWLQTGGDMREVLRTLFESPTFQTDTSKYGTLTETAFESVVSTVRIMEADYLSDPMVTTGAQLEVMRAAVEDKALQPLFDYPAPDGYHTSPPGSANLLARMHFNETAFDTDVITPDWDLLLKANYPNNKALAKAAMLHTYGMGGFSTFEATQAAQYLNSLGTTAFAELLQTLAPLITSYPQSFRK